MSIDLNANKRVRTRYDRIMNAGIGLSKIGEIAKIFFKSIGGREQRLIGTAAQSLLTGKKDYNDIDFSCRMDRSTIEKVQTEWEKLQSTLGLKTRSKVIDHSKQGFYLAVLQTNPRLEFKIWISEPTREYVFTKDAAYVDLENEELCSFTGNIKEVVDDIKHNRLRTYEPELVDWKGLCRYLLSTTQGEKDEGKEIFSAFATTYAKEGQFLTPLKQFLNIHCKDPELSFTTLLNALFSLSYFEGIQFDSEDLNALFHNDLKNTYFSKIRGFLVKKLDSERIALLAYFCFLLSSRTDDNAHYGHPCYQVVLPDNKHLVIPRDIAARGRELYLALNEKENEEALDWFKGICLDLKPVFKIELPSQELIESETISEHYLLWLTLPLCETLPDHLERSWESLLSISDRVDLMPFVHLLWKRKIPLCPFLKIACDKQKLSLAQALFEKCKREEGAFTIYFSLPAVREKLLEMIQIKCWKKMPRKVAYQFFECCEEAYLVGPDPRFSSALIEMAGKNLTEKQLILWIQADTTRCDGALFEKYWQCALEEQKGEDFFHVVMGYLPLIKDLDANLKQSILKWAYHFACEHDKGKEASVLYKELKVGVGEKLLILKVHPEKRKDFLEEICDSFLKNEKQLHQHKEFLLFQVVASISEGDQRKTVLKTAYHLFKTCNEPHVFTPILSQLIALAIQTDPFFERTSSIEKFIQVMKEEEFYSEVFANFQALRKVDRLISLLQSLFQKQMEGRQRAFIYTVELIAEETHPEKNLLKLQKMFGGLRTAEGYSYQCHAFELLFSGDLEKNLVADEIESLFKDFISIAQNPVFASQVESWGKRVFALGNRVKLEYWVTLLDLPFWRDNEPMTQHILNHMPAYRDKKELKPEIWDRLYSSCRENAQEDCTLISLIASCPHPDFPRDLVVKMAKVKNRKDLCDGAVCFFHRLKTKALKEKIYDFYLILKRQKLLRIEEVEFLLSSLVNSEVSREKVIDMVKKFSLVLNKRENEKHIYEREGKLYLKLFEEIKKLDKIEESDLKLIAFVLEHRKNLPNLKLHILNILINVSSKEANREYLDPCCFLIENLYNSFSSFLIEEQDGFYRFILNVLKLKEIPNDRIRKLTAFFLTPETFPVKSHNLLNQVSLKIIDILLKNDGLLRGDVATLITALRALTFSSLNVSELDSLFWAFKCYFFYLFDNGEINETLKNRWDSCLEVTRNFYLAHYNKTKEGNVNLPFFILVLFDRLPKEVNPNWLVAETNSKASEECGLILKKIMRATLPLPTTQDRRNLFPGLFKLMNYLARQQMDVTTSFLLSFLKILFQESEIDSDQFLHLLNLYICPFNTYLNEDRESDKVLTFWDMLLSFYRGLGYPAKLNTLKEKLTMEKKYFSSSTSAQVAILIKLSDFENALDASHTDSIELTKQHDSLRESSQGPEVYFLSPNNQSSDQVRWIFKMIKDYDPSEAEKTKIPAESNSRSTES